MSVPATSGRLCTVLSDMQVGDYIRCVYKAETSGVAGEFSNLGVKNPVDDSGTAYAELSSTDISATPIGYFHFIKADRGLLIADRVIQTTVSWSALNASNYIYGAKLSNGIVRLLSYDERTNYIVNGTLDDTCTLQDTNV